MSTADVTWRDIRFRKPGVKIEKTDLAVVEKEVGKFPDDFREFLLAVNGGTPERNTIRYETEAGAREGRIAWFFEVDSETESAEESLLEHWEDHQEALPEDVCPIARADGDDLVVLGLSGKAKGKIFYWSHDEAKGDGEVIGVDGEAVPYPHTEDALHLLAKSFSELIESLKAG